MVQTIAMIWVRIIFILFVCVVQQAAADDDLRVGPFRFQIAQGPERTFFVEIPNLKESTKLTAFLVENPTRIAVDITPPLGTSALNGKKTLTDPECTRIRVGVDERKTRIVLDCESLKGVHLASERTASGIRISFSANLPKTSSTTTTSTTLTTTTSTTLAPSTTTLPVTTSTTTTTTQPTTTSTTTTRSTTTTVPPATSTTTSSTLPSTTSTTTTVTTTTLQQKAVTPVPGAATLSKIDFDPQGAILLEFNNPADYRLFTGGRNITLFSMSNARFAAEHLKLERFAPDGVRGLLALVPQDSETGVELKIFLEEDYTLKGEWSGARLILRATRNDAASR